MVRRNDFDTIFRATSFRGRGTRNPESTCKDWSWIPDLRYAASGMTRVLVGRVAGGTDGSEKRPRHHFSRNVIPGPRNAEPGLRRQGCRSEHLHSKWPEGHATGVACNPCDAESWIPDCRYAASGMTRVLVGRVAGGTDGSEKRLRHHFSRNVIPGPRNAEPGIYVQGLELDSGSPLRGVRNDEGASWASRRGHRWFGETTSTPFFAQRHSGAAERGTRTA